MIDPARPQVERRRFRRYTPEQVRVWCTSGEFEEQYTAVNFARRLVNVGLRGVCLETAGLLRPDVKMNVEVRFDGLAGAIRSQARIVWTDTVRDKNAEISRAGLVFTGQPQVTQPVREYLEGGRPTAIRARREAEYVELKAKAVAGQEGGEPSRGGAARTMAKVLLFLILFYAAAFWGLVLLGRVPSPQPGLAYRYLGPASSGGATEETLAQIFWPALWCSQKVGVDLRYEPPRGPGQ